MNGAGSTEARLAEALDALAGTVRATPDSAYRQVRKEWRRRERRRRLVLAILIAVVFAVADLIGLWALNQIRPDSPVIFNGPAPVRHHDPADRIGPP